MKNLKEMSWEEKVLETKVIIQNIKNNFTEYKEVISTAGHKIGYRNLQHFIDDNRFEEKEGHLFIYHMAKIILQEGLSV